MANILDYLEWRGDLPFETSAFNEVDAVVFSRFSYIPFEGIVPDDFNHTVTVAEAAERFLGDAERMTQVIYEDDLKLLAAMGASRRFGDLLLCGYVNQLDEEIQKQFSAVTVKIFDDVSCVVYRGTDKTVVGWREDCNMAFLSPERNGIQGKRDRERLYACPYREDTEKIEV